MNIINDILSERLVNAIGWTIIHSLWEGIIIGIILFTILSFIPDSKSKIRYKISVTALCIFLLVSLTNLAAELMISAGVSETALAVIKSKSSLDITNVAAQTVDDNNLGATVLRIIALTIFYLKSNLILVVTFWLAGLLIFMTRFYGGYSYVKRIKYRDSNFVPAKWQNKLNSFRYKIKLAKPVRLLESAKVKIPVVIGHIKPVILVPLGMLSGFPANEVEAILAHELAHVARNDYLINILQSIAEIIFFYNPALWWMSSIICREREKCCDDIAITICGDSLTFAKALTNLETIEAEKYQLALAINSKKNLTSRIKRLFNIRMRKTMIDKTFAAGIVAILLFTATVFASTLNIHGVQSPIIHLDQNSDVELFSVTENISASVTTDTIESVGLSETLTLIEPALALIDDFPDSNKIYDSTLPNDNLTGKKKLTIKEKQLLHETEEKIREQETLIEIQEEKKRKQEKIMQAQEEKMHQLEAKMRIQEEQMREREKVMRTEEEKMKEEEKKMRIEEEKMRIEEEKMNKIEKKFISKLTDLLLKQGIISDADNFSVKLNREELYINGIKRSNDLHQEVKKMYEEASEGKLEGNFSYHITQETEN